MHMSDVTYIRKTLYCSLLNVGSVTVYFISLKIVMENELFT